MKLQTDNLILFIYRDCLTIDTYSRAITFKLTKYENKLH